MANDDSNRRRGGLKQNLASPGESNRRNVLASRGQVQDQTSPIVSEKALEQPTIKPGGVLNGRSTVRPEPAVATTGLTTTEKFKLGPRGPQDIAGAGTQRKTVEPQGLSDKDLTLLANLNRQKVKSTPIIRGGKVVGLRGTPPKPEAEVKKPKSFSIFSMEGIKNIFERSGEIAERRTTPGALAKLAKSRRATAGRKEKRASLKQMDTSIKEVSASIEKLSLTEGNDETISSLQAQLQNTIRERADVASGGRKKLDTSTVSGFATQLKELGLSDDEVRTVSQRRFAGAGT